MKVKNKKLNSLEDFSIKVFKDAILEAMETKGKLNARFATAGMEVFMSH